MISNNHSTNERTLHFTIQNISGLCILVLLFLSFGLLYSYYTPLWNPPDEERHFAYLEYIALNHKLPPLTFDQEGTHLAQAIHPPLYYLIASLFCKNDGKLLAEEIFVNDGPGFNTISHPRNESFFPYSGKARTAHLLRYFSLALSAVTICVIYLLMLTIFPGETTLALATALFAGMNPQFLHISASISNENLSTTFSTIYLFVLLRYVNCSVKVIQHIATGVLLGCCLLSKSSTIFYLPLTIGTIAWVYFRDKRKLIESLSLVLSIGGLLAGWWYLRNWLVLGDPLLSKLLTLSQPWFVRHTSPSISEIITLFSKTFTSFFGNFGALQILIPKVHLFIYGGIILLSTGGLYRLVTTRELTTLQSRSLCILLLALFGSVAIFILMNSNYLGVSMGRYLFVVIAPIAIGICTGIRSLFPLRLRNFALAVLSLLLIVLNLNIFLRVLKPSYAETALTSGVEQATFCCPTKEINRTTTIGQTFVSPKNNLSAIRVMFSSLPKQRSGEAIFSLTEASTTGKVLYQINLPLKEIDDWTRFFFTFPPISDSMNKAYTFRFESPSLPAGNGVSLWHESYDVYPGGSMLVNSRPTAGDLYFTAYCFTGEHPQTDWEGRKLAVIQQGRYITMREWQLYNERSEDFRRKTITHAKLKYFQEALNYRKSMTKQGD
jgi:hypothetical protein